MPIVSGTPGWFGKLACLGDFASRRIDNDTREAWDRWLSQALLAGRANWGDEWLARYLQAPIWCWLQAPGEHGRAWTAGTWMASVDQAGRYFPLVMVVPLSHAPEDLADWLDIDAVLRAMVQASLATLGAAASVSAFESDLARWHEAPRVGAASPVTSWVLGHFAARLHGASLWWIDGRDGARMEERWPLGAGFLIDGG